MVKTIGKNLGVLLLLGILIYGATIYWDSIVASVGKHLPSSATNILGVTINKQQKTIAQKQQEVGKAVESVVKDQTNAIKQQVLHITVGDILQTVGRAQKISHDAQITGKYITEQVSNFTKSITKPQKK